MGDALRVPDATGHFGPYGGRFVPETLVHALDELAAEYESSRTDAACVPSSGPASSSDNHPPTSGAVKRSW